MLMSRFECENSTNLVEWKKKEERNSLACELILHVSVTGGIEAKVARKQLHDSSSSGVRLKNSPFHPLALPLAAVIDEVESARNRYEFPTWHEDLSREREVVEPTIQVYTREKKNQLER